MSAMFRAPIAGFGAVSRPRCKSSLALCLVMLFAVSAAAQRQMERLGRGVVAVRASTTLVYVGWRLLGDDPEDLGFNLYRSANGGSATKLNSAPLTNSCNFADSTADFTKANIYFVRPVIGGVEQDASAGFTLGANAAVRQYLSIPLTQPPGGTSPATADGTDAGGPYSYNANDCSAADLDGDGEYEIILKWDPTNSKDNSQSGFTGNTYLDAYTLAGTRLWRINLGPNIRSGAHYMDFMVFDFDGDGKAELMCRTAPGSQDGEGNYVGGEAKWQDANGPRPSFNDTDDYRTTGPNGENGYVLAGPEFITVFNGDTGAELATATYYPKRDQDNNNDNPTSSRINTVWGDGYGNRLDRFLAGVAYVDGKQPSAIFCRGYYTRAFLVAWDWRDGQLRRRWVFDSNDGTPGNLAYRGQGAHSLTVGDVDGDGKDEIVYGAAAIDDNGKGLYSTGLGHGDAEHLSDMDPNRPGLEVWMVHESPSSYGQAGLEFRDAGTGALIFGVDGQNSDVGRGVAIDIDPRYPGYEMWGSRGGLMSATGVQISSTRPSQMNFAIWWDADLLREILDGTTISKWNWLSSSSSSILSTSGLASNNSTKSTPCLSADLFGDWREEVIWRTSNNSELRIFTTTLLATNRFYTLMHDPQYRDAIAWQNTGYNQPPHPGFYIGPNMYPQPLSPISHAQLVWRGGGGNVWDDGGAANWRTNEVWSSNNPAAVFQAMDSVLFDISGSNNTAIALAGQIVAGGVTVFSPKDYTFSGSGWISGSAGLLKAGQGTLTVNTTNTFSGATRVAGGTLLVNGSLDGSRVTVERRGTPEGPSRLGGNGRLGGGLVLQRGAVLFVGPATNAAGTLTVSNQFSEAGNVLNQFDLSDDAAGIAKLNDTVTVTGDLVLSGTNTIEITQLDDHLGGGVYPLFSYSGALTGGLSNLVLSGNFMQPVTLTNPPGVIGLLAIVPAAPPNVPSNLSAVVASAFQIKLQWVDSSADENSFVIERSTNGTSFTGIASVDENQSSYADFGLSAGVTYYYRVRAVNLAGASDPSNTAQATTSATPPSLVWRGDGTANVWDLASTANWRDGAQVALYADGAFVTFDNSGSNSPGINLSTVLNPGSVTVNASKAYNFSGTGSLSGAMALRKTGSSSLTISTANSYTGGTILSNGTVFLGSAAANPAGLGSGPVTFYGGTLEFAGFSGSSSPDYGGSINPILIPAGQTGTIRVPQRFSSPGLNGAVSGGGTLNLVVNYVRGDINGNWINFTGRVNVLNSGTDVDDFRVLNAAGFPNARLNVATNVLMYSRAATGSVIPIGEFSGAPGAVVSAGFGSSAGVQNLVTWRVGRLNTDATNSALIQGTTSIIKEGSGTWTLTGSNTYSGTTTVNEGTLVVNGNQSGALGALTVGTNGTLGGNGVMGASAIVQGTLSPGNSLGTLTFNGSVTLDASSRLIFEFNRALPGNDLLRASSITCAGTLEVVNLSPELPVPGDNFKLFDAANFSGSFSAFDLPELYDGAAWSTIQLPVDGRLWVVRTTSPTIASAAISGNNIMLSGTGGTPNWFYYVVGSTNLALPVEQWTPVATNSFDASGGFSATNQIDAGTVGQFYMLRLP